MVLEEKIVINLFLLFRYYLPLDKSITFYFSFSQGCFDINLLVGIRFLKTELGLNEIVLETFRFTSTEEKRLTTK